MITVHHLNNSRSQRVLWLLEEFGVRYQVRRYEAGQVTRTFITPQLTLHLDFLESELASRPWFAGGQFTAADVQMSFPLEAAASRAGLNASRPKLMAFLDRIHARPAYRQALERGGPYDF